MVKDILKKKISRREAISTGAKIGIAAGIAAVAAGVGGYFGGLSSAPTREVTKTVPGKERTVTQTIKETITQTVKETITVTAPAVKPLIGSIEAIKGVKAEPGTLNVIASPDTADFLTYAAQEFMKSFPNVTVKVTPLSWEVLYPKILTDLQSKGGAFDLYTIDVMTLGSVVEAGSAEFEEIRRKFPDLPEANYQDFMKLYFKYGSVWKGKIYGVPVYPNAMFFYYRKDYFEDPKIKSDFKDKFGRPLEVPKTWKETIEVAKFFTKSFNPNSPTEHGIGLMFPTTHTMMYMMLNWLGPYRQGPTGVSKYGPYEDVPTYGDYFDANKKIWFNNEDGLEAVRTIQELNKYAPDPYGSDYGETVQYFAQGVVAMVPQWSVPWGDFVKGIAGGDPRVAAQKIGVVLMPGLLDQGKYIQKPVSGGWAMGINGFSANPKSAFMFAYFATSKEMDKVHWTRFLMPPARLSNFDDPEVKQVVPWFETYPLTMANLSNRPRIPQEPEMERIGNPMWQDILKTEDKSAIRSKLDKLASEWNNLAAQFKG